MIELKNITKKYKSKLALDDVSLNLNKGVIGLIGPNGAGKTTLIRIICTIVRQSKGQIIYKNEVIEDNNLRVLRNDIGYMPQELSFYESMTIYQYLDYFATIDGIEKEERKKRIENLIIDVELEDKKNTKLKHLSGGMRRRVGLCQALLRNPKILVLDEPTVGLDPEQRKTMRKIIYEYGQEHCVLISTHLTEDIESISDRVLLLEKGQLIEDTTVSEMLDRAKGHIFSCEKSSSFKEIKKEYVISEKIYKGKPLVRFFSKEKPLYANCIEETPNLEDAYLYLRGSDRYE